jgi:hypothetical protein
MTEFETTNNMAQGAMAQSTHAQRRQVSEEWTCICSMSGVLPMFNRSAGVKTEE